MEKSNAAAPEIELRDITRVCGTVRANDGVNLRVQGGSIHAIVGENGAGKSTAMKILFGQMLPDRGEILIRGERRRWRSSADAIASGIGMVHQHFMLAGNHTAVENILLSAGKSFVLDRASARARLRALVEAFQMEVDLDRPVEELPVGMQQRIEILRLLFCDSRILILDEPTAVLAPVEVDALFATLRKMAAEGRTILIVTHKLKEVMSLAHRVTIFRAGRVVAEREVASTSIQELASLMVGREVSRVVSAPREAGAEETVLELRGARPRDPDSRLREISLRVRAGEVLGIAGVEGNGQTELIRLLANPRRELGSGEYHLLGERAEDCRASDVRARAVGIFPEDRLAEGMLLDSDLTDNFILGRARRAGYRSAGVALSHGAARAATAAAIAEYDVRPADPGAIARSLSGGNQQKLVVARELSESPRFLLAAQPTRGVDIGAIEFIHSRLLSLRAGGAGILLISSELEEVLQLADRVLVLYHGRVVGEFSKGQFDENKIGLLMAGGGDA